MTISLPDRQNTIYVVLMTQSGDLMQKIRWCHQKISILEPCHIHLFLAYNGRDVNTVGIDPACEYEVIPCGF